MTFSLDELDLDAVRRLIVAAADEEVMPRYQSLAEHEIEEKGRGDLVTAADIAVEKRLSAALTDLLPGSVTVGEEGVHADPRQIERLDGERPVWLIDPVDGTGNFAQGREPFCIMLALVLGGHARAGWIYAPVRRELAEAVEGRGAGLNGKRLGPNRVKPLAQMKGAVHVRYIPEDMRTRMEPGLAAFASNKELYCAGETYLRLAKGELDHAFFWRTKPWDHGPGELILREAGGRTAFPDGTAYRASLRGYEGMVAVAAAESFDPVCAALGLIPGNSAA